jgi:hypothetical protein
MTAFTWNGSFPASPSTGDTLVMNDITYTRTSLGTWEVTGGVAITETGALNSGSITSGFGTINNGASSITTTGALGAGATTVTTFTSTGIDDNATSTALTLDSSQNATFAGDIVGTAVTLHSNEINATGNSGNIYTGYAKTQNLYFYTGGTTGVGSLALTLDTSQNATFAGAVTATGAVNANNNIIVKGSTTSQGIIQFSTAAATYSIRAGADMGGMLNYIPTGGAYVSYINNVEQFRVTASGATFAGTITGNGSGLTALNGSNISSGTIAAARVETLNQNTTGSSGSCTGNAATVTNGVYTTGDQTIGGVKTFSGSITTPFLTSTATATRDKIRVWTTATYTIGMDNAISFGAINNEYAMTFQMNNDSNRGFWWGDEAHTDAQGAMSLSTDGKLTVATGARIGFGEADTTIPSAGLQVNGSVTATSFVGNVTGSSGSCTGNAATATSADNIDGVAFTNTGSNSATNADTIASNGISYYNGVVDNFSGNATDGALYSQAHSSTWQHQIAGDYRSGQIALRGKNNNTWQAWRKVWDVSNDGSGSGLDADLLDGFNSGENGANIILKLTANGYSNISNWTNIGGAGIYSTSVNGAHFYPNTASSYGTWRINGSRGGYSGIYHADGGGVVSGMYDSSGNGGTYREAGGGWYTYYNLANACLGVSDHTTSSAYSLYVTGAIYATGNITAYSDRRVKENIRTIDNALETVEKMRGVYYNRIDDENKKTEIGFIAQEVDEVKGAKPLVTYAEDVDQYGVSYGNTTALLVEAIKELSQQVKDLQTEIKEMKNA